jgi:predicted enzyme related to lactoylglutathione lyase
MARVVHFEIHAGDPEGAAAFYRDLFGWEIVRWEGPMEYWMIRTGASGETGIDGGLLRRRGDPPVSGQAVNAYVCTVGVENLDDVLARGTRMGAEIAVPRMAVPGIGWLAYLTDTEGNLLGLLQPDPAAS